MIGGGVMCLFSVARLFGVFVSFSCTFFFSFFFDARHCEMFAAMLRVRSLTLFVALFSSFLFLFCVSFFVSFFFSTLDTVKCFPELFVVRVIAAGCAPLFVV